MIYSKQDLRLGVENAILLGVVRNEQFPAFEYILHIEPESHASCTLRRIRDFYNSIFSLTDSPFFVSW